MSKEQKINCRKCVTDWNKDQCSCNCHKETKLPKCNCQYEEGHSFECPLYKPTPNPLEEPKESFEERTAKKLDNDILDKICEEPKEWEERFDKEFPIIEAESFSELRQAIKEIQSYPPRIKQFISQVESKAKQETLAKVRGMIEETFENFNLHDWSGEQEVYNEINRLKGKVLDKLKGI